MLNLNNMSQRIYNFYSLPADIEWEVRFRNQLLEKHSEVYVVLGVGVLQEDGERREIICIRQ